MSKILWEGHGLSNDPTLPAPMRPRFSNPSITNFWLRHWTNQSNNFGVTTHESVVIVNAPSRRRRGLLQCCACLSVVCFVWLNGGCYRAKVTWQPIGSRIWEIDCTKMNDLDLCLKVVSRSRQPVRYIRRWIQDGPKKVSHEILYISLSNIDRFSQFFHCRVLWKICNKVVTKHTTTP